MCFPCSTLNTDQHGQNTGFFSLKYGSPYIDLNRLEKKLDPYFWHFTQCYFICTFLKNCFRFSVFLGQLLRCGHILPNLKLNWGHSVLFAKKYGFSVFNTKYRFSVFNIIYGSTRTKYGVFLA